jgi:hypothetical protein
MSHWLQSGLGRIQDRKPAVSEPNGPDDRRASAVRPTVRYGICELVDNTQVDRARSYNHAEDAAHSCYSTVSQGDAERRSARLIDTVDAMQES